MAETGEWMDDKILAQMDAIKSEVGTQGGENGKGFAQAHTI